MGGEDNIRVHKAVAGGVLNVDRETRLMGVAAASLGSRRVPLMGEGAGSSGTFSFDLVLRGDRREPSMLSAMLSNETFRVENGRVLRNCLLITVPFDTLFFMVSLV